MCRILSNLILILSPPHLSVSISCWLSDFSVADLAWRWGGLWMLIACQVFLLLPDVLYRPGGVKLMMCGFLPSCGGNLVLASQHCLVGLWMSDVCQLSSYQLPDVLNVALQSGWPMPCCG